MATVTKLNYARLFNTGNYTNERIEVEAILTPEDNPVDVIQDLAESVEAQWAALVAARKAEAQRRYEALQAAEPAEVPPGVQMRSTDNAGMVPKDDGIPF